MKKPVVGAQLFTVCKYLKTADGVAESLDKVAKIGYKTAQLSGLGPAVPMKDVAAFARRAGVRIVATHTGWGRFLNELDAVIEEHRMLECSHPAIGGLPGEYKTEAGLARFIEELTPIAEKLAAAGMDFSYHNHDIEFTRFGGQTWLEMLYKKASPRILKAELDTYWVQRGGGNPEKWIRQCAGRQPLLHLKDLSVSATGETRTAEVGEGNLDWPAILKAASECGVEHLLVEQDNCYERDPFESLAISYRNLEKMGYC